MANLFGSLVLGQGMFFTLCQLIQTVALKAESRLSAFEPFASAVQGTRWSISLCGTVVNLTIENFYHRTTRLTREVILPEPTTTLREVLDVIPQPNDRLKTYPTIEPPSTVVTLSPLTATQYEIAVDFCLLVHSDEEEKRARQEIRMDMAWVLASCQNFGEKTLPANATLPVRTAPRDLMTL
jgi:hypothetical protein